MRAVRPAPGILIAALGLCALAGPRIAAAAPPKLVLVVSIDQLSAHQLERWGPLFTGGLGRLMRQGAFYTQARFAYANTETAPGHATLATGAWPSAHGVVANYWYAEGSGREVYCYEDAKYGRSPANLQAPTVADALRLATAGKGKVVSVSLKDRAAIPLGGHRPDLAAWYEEASGRMVSGRWPGARTPAWFEGAVADMTAESVRGQPWERLRADLDYTAHAGPDDHPAEGDIPGLGRTFPRRVPEDLAQDALREIYPTTPQALDALFQLARVAVKEEALGQHPVTDLLAIGVTTTDYVGHWWGGYSHEALDTLLRVDARLGELLAHLDRTLGRGQVLVLVSADHGITPTPEKAPLLGISAERLDKKRLLDAMQAVLPPGTRVVDIDAPAIYLSPTPPGVDRLALARKAAAALMAEPGIVEAYAPEDVARFPQPFATFYARSLFPGRRPDVQLRARPHAYISRVDAEGRGTGTGHGAPYLYDQAVPVLLAGPGVRAGVDRRPVDMTRVAPTLAALLGIPPPAAAFDAPLPAADP
jgi:predicted AlkP superfamily pyrophosphatase or phosphodiesterase